MRLFSFQDQQGHHSLGALLEKDSSQYIDLCATDPNIPKDLLALIQSDRELTQARRALLNPQAVIHNLSDIHFTPLIHCPEKIICLGLNYADHAKEGGHARPDYPSFFMRGPSSLTAHQAPIIRPKASTKLDYEAELAFVMGKRAKHCSLENALEHVVGYSIFIAETIVLITECMTLEPGDVVITGTPAGVGYARTPPVFMKPGDICEVEIEGIGILSNSIADEH